ncbi:type I-C CRISPR-associated protein Cas8c/Csd1 [Leptolyngbya sp. PCC 6406]|uniref:type I-C CRISPR-associated protein Cas8c/Csd1 n=1 Tax=Leptolyngbya sp. PCC 6406 TaxID=1173264 RepID=UPI0002ABBEFA|nr:type I-C CRISPR-associated protein Cas8c/Csd1 [Leptolyngbya sp. PCC 6406]
MLRELYSLSQHVEEVLPPIGYGLVEAHIAISVDPPVIFLPKVTEDSKGKERLGEKLYLPDFVRSSNHRPLAVADTADYILGIGKHGLIRRPMYLDLLKECLNETQDEAVEAVWQAVQELDVEAIRKSCSPWFDKGEPLDKVRIIFIYKGELVTDRSSVQKFWGRKFTELLTSWEVNDSKKKKANKNLLPNAEPQSFREGICSITGDLRQFVGPTLPVMIKGVPNTQGKGAALMSFNCESFESRQWKDSEHAPLGFEVAERSHQMLNRLLREKRHSYQQGKTKFVYWGEYDTGLNPDIWDNPDDLWDDDSATVAQMIFISPEQPQGFSTEACKSERFYLAILTGCDGRIAISRWDELTPQTIADNVTRYIQTQKGISGYRARPIWQLAGACFRDPAKEQVDGVVRALVNNALWGAAIPESIVRQTIERIYLDLFSDKRDLKKYHGRYYARFQILALYLGLMTDKRPLEISRRLGAIAYLMHHAEMKARNLDDPGKTGVATSLRALATTPKQVFGRLYQNAILYHLPAPCKDGEPQKQESRRRNLKRTGKLIREEFGKLVEMNLSPETDLPTTFSLDESAWFYLGWGMREATFWDGVESNKSNSNAVADDQETMETEDEN